MKALEEMTSEELIALAKQREGELATKNQELEDAAKIVEKLKTQAKDTKNKQGKKTVKHEGKTYVFPSESWTEPSDEIGGELTTVTAEEASKNKDFVAKLVERKFLIEEKK